MILKEPSENKYNHIPLSNDFGNWWYFGRKEILKRLLLRQKFTSNINILEIGPGVGVNIEVLQNFGSVDILEVDYYFIELIEKNHKLKINKVYKDFSKIEKKYDLIIFLDVLEHIENYEFFIQEVDKIMKDRGIGIMSVPAYQKLFSQHDKNLHHYRRYNWKLIKKHLEPYFKVINKIGYNFLLLPVRFIQIKIINSDISDTTVSPILNFILTTIIKFEVLLFRLNLNLKFGLSLFAVFEKENDK
tara:strand:- start:3621 stop:4355 length:735 start_codon:yes stop_codon:yes gene_type:complete